MTIRTVSAALILALAAVPVVACTIEKEPAPPPATAATPPPAPAPAPVETPQSVPCAPIGVWKVSGPTGSEEVKVTDAGPGNYHVWYKGTQANGQVTGNNFTFDLGKSTGGIYNCILASDCKTMSCGFSGQPPQVFTKQ